MANTKISALTSGSALALTDIFPAVETAGTGPVQKTGATLASGLLGSSVLSGQTVTTSNPVLNLSQTWNAGAVAFTGLKFNSTDTASASGSLLLDLQVGGSSKFKVDKAGGVSAVKLNGGVLYIDQSGSVANFAFGNNAAYALTAGSVGNFFMGLHAGQLVTTGINNTAIGWDSQMYNVTGQNNTSLGEDALKYVTGNSNTGLGYTAGYSITSGTGNVAIAPNALYQVTTGSYNVAVGLNAGYGLTLGATRNTVVGYGTLNNVGGAATDNTAVGYTAGYFATGNNNIFLGQSAGVNSTGNGQLYIDAFGGSSSTALIYGVMTGTVATQSLQINGALKIGASDAGISRLGAASLAIGNGTAGDFSGSLKLATLTVLNTGSIVGSNNGFFIPGDGSTITVNQAGYFGFSSLNNNASGAQDVKLWRDAANTLALHNSTNAQTFNVYNTYTDASNYERLSIVAYGSGIAIRSDAAGTGTNRGVLLDAGTGANGRIAVSSNGIYLGSPSAYAWTIPQSTGNLLAFTDNTYDIGASGANRARNAYLAGKIVTGSTTLHETSVALTNGAGAGAGTLTNAPAAGNPTKWIPINDNGTTRYIPAW